LYFGFYGGIKHPLRASPIVWKNNLLSLFIWKKKKNSSPTVWNRTCYLFATWKTPGSRADVSALGVAWNPEPRGSFTRAATSPASNLKVPSPDPSSPTFVIASARHRRSSSSGGRACDPVAYIPPSCGVLGNRLLRLHRLCSSALFPSVPAAPSCVPVPSIACVHQAAPVSFEVGAGRRRRRLAEAVKIHPSRS